MGLAKTRFRSAEEAPHGPGAPLRRPETASAGPGAALRSSVTASEGHRLPLRRAEMTAEGRRLPLRSAVTGPHGHRLPLRRSEIPFSALRGPLRRVGRRKEGGRAELLPIGGGLSPAAHRWAREALRPRGAPEPALQTVNGDPPRFPPNPVPLPRGYGPFSPRCAPPRPRRPRRTWPLTPPGPPHQASRCHSARVCQRCSTDGPRSARGREARRQDGFTAETPKRGRQKGDEVMR